VGVIAQFYAKDCVPEIEYREGVPGRIERVFKRAEVTFAIDALEAPWTHNHLARKYTAILTPFNQACQNEHPVFMSHFNHRLTQRTRNRF
jgi:hypothetical protein